MEILFVQVSGSTCSSDTKSHMTSVCGSMAPHGHLWDKVCPHCMVHQLSLCSDETPDTSRGISTLLGYGVHKQLFPSQSF